MKQTYISEISKHLGEEVTIKGWLYNKRSSGKLGFLEIRDGSGIIQGVVSKKDVSDTKSSGLCAISSTTTGLFYATRRSSPRRPVKARRRCSRRPTSMKKPT